MYKKNIICSFGSKIFTNFKMAACPSFIKMKRPSFVSQKMKLKKDMLPFWYLWIFLSQNFSLCSPCMYLLTLKRIKQFFNLFVSKKPLKNVSFVWKIGLGWFVFSTTVFAHRLLQTGHFETSHFQYSELQSLDLTHFWQNYINLLCQKCI